MGVASILTLRNSHCGQRLIIARSCISYIGAPGKQLGVVKGEVGFYVWVVNHVEINLRGCVKRFIRVRILWHSGGEDRKKGSCKFYVSFYNAST